MKLLKVQNEFETISQPQIKIKICSKINYQKKVKKKNEKDKDKDNFLKKLAATLFRSHWIDAVAHIEGPI